MYIHGQFINRKGKVITIEILSKGDRTEEKVIGSEGSGIYFQDDPIEITNEMNDTFDHLLRHSCTIRLLCRDFISDFYNTSCRSTIVNVRQDDTIIFAGYIEPLVFSQGYNFEYDEVEINCIDILSSLQYSQYMGAGMPGVNYEDIRSQAKQRTFMQILESILCAATTEVIINKDKAINTFRVCYDDSKSIDKKETETSIFHDISISDLLFLEEEEEDVWTQDKVVEEIMRYLDLHIVQNGVTYYIYAWETLRNLNNDNIKWKDLTHNQSVIISPRSTIDITLDTVADDDTQINIDEAFNKLVLKSDTKSMKNLIRSPLDKDDLFSPFTGKQFYLREIVSPGGTKTPKQAFIEACTGGRTTDWGKAYFADWYIRVMNNSKWKFRPQSVMGVNASESYFPYAGDNRHQYVLPDFIGRSRGTALLEVGCAITTLSTKDNSVKSKVDMEECLVIGIHGVQAGLGGSNSPNKGLMSMIPCATYEDTAEAGIYSPADNDTTNYMVISGKIAYNPIRELSCPPYVSPVYYKDLHAVKGRNDNEYYTQEFYKAETPSSKPILNLDVKNGFVPYSDKTPQYFKLQRNINLQDKDDISKLSVLMCMLVIGDKCLVEKKKGEKFFDGDTPGTGNGTITDYVWRKYKTPGECIDDKEYYSQSFSIGFDPKIDDLLVGTEYDIQNNINIQMNLDAEGMAIPMRKTDKLKGAVKFTILCPAQPIYTLGTVVSAPPWEAQEIESSMWGNYLLNAVESIVIKDFEIKLYSDNGHYEQRDENDIIYTSDTDESYVNAKDDLEFKITSALTAEESYALGVKTSLSLSTPFDVKKEEQLLEVYDRNTGEMAKPEQHYVANHYADCHVPRVTIMQNIENDGENVSIVNRYRHPAMNKVFWVTGISQNIMEGTASMSLREI